MPLNNKCFVTGASGFVGRQLCRRLLEDGFAVVGVVRTQAAFPEFAGRAFTQVGVGNIDGQTDWSQALTGVDTVFHLAAENGSRHGSIDEQLQRLRKVNVAGTAGLARAAVSHGVRRFVHLSSIKVNGEQTSLTEPFSEASIPAPITPYGVSKWEAEQALWSAVNGTNTETVVIRPPLVYGKAVKGNFLQLLRMVEGRIPLPFRGIHNLRSLIYLENLVDALVTCAVHPKAAGQTFLVHDGEDISTQEWVEYLSSGLGVSTRLFYSPAWLMQAMGKLARKTEQVDRLFGSLRVDSSKIIRELNWVAPSSQDQGMANTVTWFKNLRLENME